MRAGPGTEQGGVDVQPATADQLIATFRRQMENHKRYGVTAIAPTIRFEEAEALIALLEELRAPRHQAPIAGAVDDPISRLSRWLCDQREQLEPSSERWRALADVSQALHTFTSRPTG
jgi:hypothetical protein